MFVLVPELDAEAALALVEEAVDLADVGMSDLARDADFLAEAFKAAGVIADGGGEELEGDGLAEFEIIGAVDLAHAALAEHGDDAVAILQHCSGLKAGGIGGADRRG